MDSAAGLQQPRPLASVNSPPLGSRLCKEWGRRAAKHPQISDFWTSILLQNGVAESRGAPQPTLHRRKLLREYCVSTTLLSLRWKLQLRYSEPRSPLIGG